MVVRKLPPSRLPDAWLQVEDFDFADTRTRNELAFEYWYSLGPRRKLVRVAERMGLSTPAIYKTARIHGWKQKAYQRDQDLIAQLRSGITDDLIHRRLELLKLVRGQIKQYEDRITDGFAGPISTDDFVKLVKLEMELCGIGREGATGGTGTDYDAVIAREAGVRQRVTIELSGDPRGPLDLRRAFALDPGQEGQSPAPVPERDPKKPSS